MGLRQSGYEPRLLDGLLDRRLRGFGAVEVAGAKFCGKTWTSFDIVIGLSDGRWAIEVKLSEEKVPEAEKPPPAQRQSGGKPRFAK